MLIRVLGSGCKNCTTLAARTREAVQSLGIEADVVDEHDVVQIARAGVMSTPALEVDGTVVVAGRVPDTAHIAELLASAGAGNDPR